MLNSNDRRPAFDCFFASLDDIFRETFMHEVMAQWFTLRDDGENVTSIIDCMENVWDYWRDLRHANPSHFGPLDHNRAIMAHMLDPQREARERELRAQAGLSGGPRSA